MRYVMARFENEMREMTYRIYVTDALKILANADQRYYNIWCKEEIIQEETRTSDDIIQGISNKLSKIGGESSGNNAS